MVLAILKQTLIGVTVAPVDLAMTVENVGDKFSLVN
jgi:hypothetical protein